MLFVSYASQDRKSIEPLLTALRRARQQVWWDNDLGGGEAWWREILEQIRRCQVFIVAATNNSLRSKPCQAEFSYAQALQRPILPIQIGPIDNVRLTPLAATHILDYRNPTKENTHRLITSVQRTRARSGPLPPRLPAEPPVPFAYLMRLAATLERRELSRHQQDELLLELTRRLEDDRHDPKAVRDITALLYKLRDRRDVMWGVRNDIDRTLASIDAFTVPFPGPRSSDPRPVPQPPRETLPSPSPQSAPKPPGDLNDAEGGSAGGRPNRRFSRTWYVAGAACLAIVAVTALVIIKTTTSADDPLKAMLLGNTEVGTIMGAKQMTPNEEESQFKDRGRLSKLSEGDCAGVLYPGLNVTYQHSDGSRVRWRVQTDPPRPPKMARAGSDLGYFVDQGVTSYPPNSEQPAAILEQSAKQWAECAGRTVTVTYAEPPSNEYAWTLRSPTRQGTSVGGSTLLLTYAERSDPRYTCQRALSAVYDFVVDVKACGDNVTDQGSQIASMLAVKASESQGHERGPAPG